MANHMTIRLIDDIKQSGTDRLMNDLAGLEFVKNGDRILSGGWERITLRSGISIIDSTIRVPVPTGKEEFRAARNKILQRVKECGYRESIHSPQNLRHIELIPS